MKTEAVPRGRPLCSEVAGVPMAGLVFDTADQPVFVLVHGLGMSGRYMMPTARLLAPFGKVFVPDLPGFGRSGKPTEILTIPELSDALAEWMEDHGTGSAVLVGNSLGAQIIVDFAVRHPGKIHGAVLEGLTIDPSARSVTAQIFRLLIDISREPAALYWIAVSDYLRAGFKRVLGTLRHALEDPVSEKLPLIGCPVLLVRGERDPIVPMDWLEKAHRLVPGSSRAVIPGAAHAVNFNSPDELVTLVGNFAADIGIFPAE